MGTAKFAYSKRGCVAGRGQLDLPLILGPRLTAFGRKQSDGCQRRLAANSGGLEYGK